MPIYEYECNACKAKFELLIRSSLTAVACPACANTGVKRLMSAFAFTSKDTSGNIVSSSGCSGCDGGNCSHCHA